MSTPPPTIYLIAGCNGAGKTPFSKEFLPTEVRCLRFQPSKSAGVDCSGLHFFARFTSTPLRRFTLDVSSAIMPA
jgi:hypothetical protein